MKNANPNFIVDVESIHCKCSRSSSQIFQLTDVCGELQCDICGEVMKLLSVDPQNYSDAPREGIRRIMEEIDFIRMGTTVVTNALVKSTSIDISRYDGEYEHVFESTTAGVTIQAPQSWRYRTDNDATRNLQGNLVDLKALVATNQKGIHLILELTLSYELEVVQAYMAHIQHHAEVVVRNLLRDVSMTTDGVLRASDKMDDGSMINLRVEIDSQKGSATFDFEGTSPMVINKFNAPRAISKSVIIYSLRCMVGYDIPLNQGCLAPIHLLIPK
ncbi:unnamed protein product [Clavelina lepadiformis]|uniref:Hydantoinase B/oxoprolinase domain-containing protein n=1 Tax=Clavelina lepadiformis TaxID=159417 RepID=A0ABP0FWW4_CLALP